MTGEFLIVLIVTVFIATALCFLGYTIRGRTQPQSAGQNTIVTIADLKRRPKKFSMWSGLKKCVCTVWERNSWERNSWTGCLGRGGWSWGSSGNGDVIEVLVHGAAPLTKW